MEDIEDTGKSFIIQIKNTKTKVNRFFVVNEDLYPKVKLYFTLRKAIDTKDLPATLGTFFADRLLPCWLMLVGIC